MLLVFICLLNIIYLASFAINKENHMHVVIGKFMVVAKNSCYLWAKMHKQVSFIHKLQVYITMFYLIRTRQKSW